MTSSAMSKPMINNVQDLTSCSSELLVRIVEREKSGRKHAEKILENVSRELYRSNAELRKQAMLLENEVERNNAIFESSVEGIMLFDKTGHVEAVNPAARKIFGLENAFPQDLQICTVIPSLAFCKSDDQCLVPNDIHATLGDRNEAIARRVDGTEIPVEFVVTEYLHNHQVSYSGMVRDLSKRKALEAQLTHAQKMESVGQLAAGIAHELNTPIQFVGDNTRFLQNSFQSIEDILVAVYQLLEKCDAGSEIDSAAAHVRSILKDADIDFIRDEIPLAIEQTLQGADTVARIVRAMKVFSHPGSDDLQEVDLNIALESTITISRGEWKYHATIKQEFDPGLPKIRCLPGELNQVFLNLIVNAAHAIASKSESQVGTITVRTFYRDQRIFVEIEDTGTGIPAKIQNRIFDPFFTTKGVGKGTGQGLTLCYQIVVERHHGNLTFRTLEGVGTTFVVELPLTPEA